MGLAKQDDRGVPRITALNAQQAIDHWQDYAHTLDRALRYSHRPDDNLDAIRLAVKNNRARVTLIYTRAAGYGVAVTELMETKHGEYLNIWALGGHAMEWWLDALVDHMERYGRELGVKGLIMGGRTGWMPTLKSHGFKTKSVIMTREFD